MSDEKKKATVEKDEAAVRDAIALMPDDERPTAERLHDIIKTNAPDLWARTWYGMPAYTNGSKIVCFFRSRKKFGERYITFGFNDVAKLDDGNMWPITFAITTLTADDEVRIAELVKKAVS
jgi:uncharacterized protein YdhG (YjbR/CyaY superfamily)